MDDNTNAETEMVRAYERIARDLRMYASLIEAVDVAAEVMWKSEQLSEQAEQDRADAFARGDTDLYDSLGEELMDYAEVIDPISNAFLLRLSPDQRDFMDQYDLDMQGLSEVSFVNLRALYVELTTTPPYGGQSYPNGAPSWLKRGKFVVITFGFGGPSTYIRARLDAKGDGVRAISFVYHEWHVGYEMEVGEDDYPLWESLVEDVIERGLEEDGGCYEKDA